MCEVKITKEIWTVGVLTRNHGRIKGQNHST